MFFHGFVKKAQTGITTVNLVVPVTDNQGVAQTVSTAPAITIVADDDFDTVVETIAAATVISVGSLAAGVAYYFPVTLSNLTVGKTYTAIATYLIDAGATTKYEILKFAAY